MNSESTTIRISKELKSHLDLLAESKTDTYENILWHLLTIGETEILNEIAKKRQQAVKEKMKQK